MVTNKKKVLIIGGGIGGLVSGAILAKEGFQVRVLEKHTVAGGGLHTFNRFGVTFETGMHMISGFQEGGLLRKLSTYLGFIDKISVKDEDTDGFEYVRVGSDGRCYKMARGRENFIQTLSSYFPEEHENIRRYVDKIYEICHEISLLNWQIPSSNIHNSMNFMLISINDFIASFTQNSKLQTVLGWNNMLYGGTLNRTPALIAALITQSYIEGASRFVGGSQQFANALIEVIEQHEGEVLTNNGADFIDIEHKHIQKVRAKNGQEFTADWYISAIHPSSMFKLMDTTKIQKSYYQRINNIPNSYSGFITFIKFKENNFPYLNHTNFYMHDYVDFWKLSCYDNENWPRGCMYFTPPETKNDTFTRKMIIYCVMNYETVKQWEHSTVGKREKSYDVFKKQCEDKVLNLMEKTYPDFRSKIDKVFSATPLTIRDYYGVIEGSIYGTVTDCNDITASLINIRTKFDNLLLTGQNINLHGMLGVSHTAIQTCGELVDLKNLLNKINSYNT